MIAYKLFRIRQDKSIGPLFINRDQVITIGDWLKAREIPTKGFKVRAGWHVCPEPKAPHLKLKLKSGERRVWYKVEIENYNVEVRPKSQGGLWYLAQMMRVIEKA